jgi:hypothetical protein
MVRITLAIPEDLRYRLKLAMMDHRRKNRSRITQDEFCAHAIAAHLDQEDQPWAMHSDEEPLAAFLRDCLKGGGLTRDWASRAKALLAPPRPHARPSTSLAGKPSEPGT